MEVLRVVRAAALLAVISVGGVATVEVVQQCLDAGATLVQACTGFHYRGPLWARQINRGLRPQS
jgi:dihydroorotate dehydrogenase